MNIKIFLFFILLVFISCFDIKSTTKNKIKLDTIHSPITNLTESDECKIYSKGYYSRYGAVISNFYLYSNFTTLDYDKDGDLDSLVILRPFYYNNALDNNCNMNINDKLFLVGEVENNKIIRTIKYRNVLSKESSFLGTEEIEIHNNIFSINGDWGHSNKFYSKIYISFKENNFYIDSIYI